MLSTSVIRNVSEASHYFAEKDNYYTREEGMEQSEWVGRGAEKLGLLGEVNAEKFTDLLEGRLPNGELLGKVVDGKIKHRAGWDLTFSAPKSVSILALIGGDKRLIEAHRNAVKIALSHIEKSCSQARVKTQEGIKFQNTGNIVAALYHHDLSRAQDPQMHTHSVVMNMTQRTDGKWRSQASQIGRYDGKATSEINGFIERTRNNKRYFGKLYEAELAFQVKELGYDIVVNSKTGVFEIVGVSDEVKQFFSKRRNQVEIALQEQGLSSAKAADMATLKTRESKKSVNRENLTNEWNEQSEILGLNCKEIISNTFIKDKSKSQSLNKEALNLKAVEAIQRAAQSLSIFKTTFGLEEIVSVALSYGLHEPLSVQSLLSSLDVACDSGDLIRVENNSGKTLLMAKNTLDDEKRLFTQLENKKSHLYLLSSEKIDKYLEENSRISIDVHDHLKTVFNDERVVLVEGQSAKEKLIEPIIGLSKTENLEIAVLSPNQIGSKHFANQITQKPATIWEHIKSLFVDNTIKNYGVMQFLSHFDSNKINTSTLPDIIIVDNAHLLSTKHKADIIEWNALHDTKLILLGNNKTLLPQQTGTSIQQIIIHGVTTITIPEEKNINLNLSDKEIVKNAIDKISDKIIHVSNYDDRLHAMAAHYCKMNMQDRRASWLASHQKSSISILNNLVHNELKNSNQLGKGINVKVLIPVFVTEGKMGHASSYQKDQVVRFNHSYKSLLIFRGEYLKIVSHNKDKNNVLLEKSNGQRIVWHPDKVAGTKSGNVELFSEKTQEFSIGESVISHRSINNLNIVKGERLSIVNIQNKSIKLKNQAGKSIVIDFNKKHHSHFDYGYAAILHAIAHEKPHTLISDLPAQSLGTNQRQFYQITSQPDNTWIYTDDLNGFINRLERSSGDKLSAHDVVSKSEETKKNVRVLYDMLEKQIIECSKKENYQNLSRPAVEAIDYAIHHLAERDAGFTHKQIIETAMNHALGSVRTEDLNRAVIAIEKAGILLRGTRNDGTLWTTIDSVKIEREIISLCQIDKGKLEFIASDELLKKYCDPNKLKPEQINAIKAITQSKDRIIAIQGYAGTGKTTMLATVADVLASKEILNENGYQILGLAPTNKAVSELKKRGLPAQTLDSFLFEIQNNKLRGIVSDKKYLLLIDEASMLSNRKALAVLKVAHELNSRAVPVGDIRQLPAVESGKPFNLIQRSVDTKSLIDIQRQQDDTLKKAVKDTINFDFRAAFETLKNSIFEVNEKTHPTIDKDKKTLEDVRAHIRDKRINILIDDYFKFPKEERDNIQIITPGHDDRILVNEKIREQFKIQGALKNDGDYFFKILSPESFTQIERSQVTNFEVGNILRFGKNEAIGIKAGEYLTVVDSDHRHNFLTLMNSEGRELGWQIPKFDKERLSHVEVFKEETRALQAGDRIRWSRSNKTSELFSTESAQVISVEKNKITVILANQKQFTFDPQDPKYQHWDHGYAATVYAVQADTKSIVLAHLESHRTNLTSQPTFLVALTRAVNVFRLYTDNADVLLKTIEQNHGVKLSSLEVIGEYPRHESDSTSSKKVSQEQRAQSVFSQILNPINTSTLSNNENPTPRFNRDTLSRIKEGLNNNAEQIAMEFLGNPVERGSHYLKFGSKQGSLSVTIKGEKKGWFNDFETNTGGRDMLRFIQLYGGMNHQQAIQYGAQWLDIISDNDANLSPKIKSPDSQKKEILANDNKAHSFSDYEKRRIKYANQLANESLPIKGTLAEKYLKEHRGIDTHSLPEDLRFHPGILAKKNQKQLPALISIARTKEGKVQSVEAIFLDSKTANKANVPLKKQTIGSKKGLVVHINQTKNKDAPTLIAEGVVTGLSLANALPKTNVVVVLGKQMFSSVDPAILTNRVIFCLDNDGKNLKTDQTILAAANRLKENQKSVSFMTPNNLKVPKQDYNDILKQVGKDAIKHDFINAISYENFYNQAGIVVDKKSQALFQPTQISDKKITRFVKEIQRESLQNNNANLNVYKELNPNNKQNEIARSISPTRNIEREI